MHVLDNEKINETEKTSTKLSTLNGKMYYTFWVDILMVWRNKTIDRHDVIIWYSHYTFTTYSALIIYTWDNPSVSVWMLMILRFYHILMVTPIPPVYTPLISCFFFCVQLMINLYSVVKRDVSYFWLPSFDVIYAKVDY